MFNFHKLKAITLASFSIILMTETLITKSIVASDSSSQSPTSVTLKGTIRDFKGYRDTNYQIDPEGHPDFERGDGWNGWPLDTSPGGEQFRYDVDYDITTNNLVEGKPEYAGGSFSTTTKENFDQWYRDVAGVNQSMEYSIELVDDDGDGIYTHNNTSFFPIDNKLFGNQGRDRNFHFTYEINSQFTYQGGEVLTFSGDDDVWVYINGKRVINFGGVYSHKGEVSLNLDDVANEIGLEVGETYSFDFFFAERHTSYSNFKIETSIILQEQQIFVD